MLFELTDAVACSNTPVTNLARLSLESEQRRGHGGLYDAVNAGRIDTDQLATMIAQSPVPKVTTPDGKARIVLAVDVSNWLRPDAATSPDRAFCHTYARGRGQADMIPGWPYSFVAALETGATSWTTLLDVVRLHTDDDATAVTAAQLRAVVDSLCHAGHYHPGSAPLGSGILRARRQTQGSYQRPSTASWPPTSAAGTSHPRWSNDYHDHPNSPLRVCSRGGICSHAPQD